MTFIGNQNLQTIFTAFDEKMLNYETVIIIIIIMEKMIEIEMNRD